MICPSADPLRPLLGCAAGRSGRQGRGGGLAGGVSRLPEPRSAPASSATAAAMRLASAAASTPVASAATPIPRSRAFSSGSVGQGQDGDTDGGQPVNQRRRQLLAALRHDGRPGQPALAGRQQFRQFVAPPHHGYRPVEPLQPADQVFARVSDGDDRDAHRPAPPGFQTTEIFALLACAPSSFGICPSATSTMTTVDRADPRAVLPGVIWAISAPGQQQGGLAEPVPGIGQCDPDVHPGTRNRLGRQGLLDGHRDRLPVQPVRLPEALARHQLVLADSLGGHESSATPVAGVR